MTDPTAVIVETIEVVQIESTEVGLQGPPGINGPTDHGALTGRDNDGHPQYHTDARGDARYSGLAHAHTGVYEPANANLQAHVSSTANPHSVTAAQAGADASGTAAGLIASHEASANPHPGYLTPTEGDAAYAALGHAHTGVYDPAGTAASAVSAHAGGTDVHAIASVTGLQGALDGKSATTHDHAATYAPIASGVTHGDSHDHSGGDGAQISYENLSNLPTLGTAAATAATDYATASHNHTGTYVATGADAADLSSSTATDGYVLTADGAGGAAWEAAAVTYAGAASEIHAATDKATPVDADELGLVDSAASWVLKKLSWANLKTTLSSVFAVLAGKSGGQTLIGGTGVTDKLVLQGTSGNGTSTATAFAVTVGNNGNSTALNVNNNGKVGIGMTAGGGSQVASLAVHGGVIINYSSNLLLTATPCLFGGAAKFKDMIDGALRGVYAAFGLLENTTEQLRLGYDASNYLSATVSSTGNLTLDTTGGTIYTPDTIENTVNGAGIVLKSPDGTRYRLTVANGGTLSIAAA